MIDNTDTLYRAPTPAAVPAPLGTVPQCPFHAGAATLDLLLAELDPRDTAAFDAALDLRWLASQGCDALACIEQLFRVRRLLGDRHYLAFYRVRRWAHRAFRIEVRAGRDCAWQVAAFPLDGARLDEVVNTALAPLADADGVISAFAHVRFAFAPTL